MNGTGNLKAGIKTNVDDFAIKPKRDHVTVSFFCEGKQVAQVNFGKKPFGINFLQALQEAVWQ